MARKRMFSEVVVDTDKFIEMPLGARLLYYDLGVRADDDGFVSNPKKIMKMTNISEDDYKVLVAKEFVIEFEIGVCVITHWQINNYIRSDRYKPTIYKQEKNMLQIVNGAYEKIVGIPIVNQRYTNRKSIGNRRIYVWYTKRQPLVSTV